MEKPWLWIEGGWGRSRSRYEKDQGGAETFHRDLLELSLPFSERMENLKPIHRTNIDYIQRMRRDQ